MVGDGRSLPESAIKILRSAELKLPCHGRSLHWQRIGANLGICAVVPWAASRCCSFWLAGLSWSAALWRSSRCSPPPKWEVALWGTTAPAATACRVKAATPAAPSRKVVLAVRWVGIHLATTASRAADCHGLPLSTLHPPGAAALQLCQGWA